MELVLPDTKTYVFTIPRNAQRQARVRQQLGTLGFRDWDFVMGRTGEGDYWRHIREDFVRVLLQPGHILILEDDIETLPENYQELITLPDDTDVCYLGGGIVGSPVGGLFARRMHGEVQYLGGDRGGTAAYREMDSDWLRVMSMFFTHAVLFITESVKRAFCEAILDNPNDAVDVAQSVIQHRWNCILRKRPFWYQNDRHAHETRCYYDPAQSTGNLVTTFYDPVAGMADLALLDKWRENWTANGWRVRIVTLEDAQRVDPKRLCMFKSDAFYVGNKTMSREYLFRCYARWLCMLDGGLMVDSDVWNYGWTPADYGKLWLEAPRDKVVYLCDETCCATFGTAEAYRKYIGVFDAYHGRPWPVVDVVHDLNLTSTRPENVFLARVGREYPNPGWEKAPLVHYTHGTLPFPRSDHIERLRPANGGT